MLTGAMAAKKTAKKATTKKPSLTEIGRQAAKDAQRRALLAELDANDWNLTATAEALQVSGGSPNIIRALKQLAPDEYEAAKTDGRVSPGNRRE